MQATSLSSAASRGCRSSRSRRSTGARSAAPSSWPCTATSAVIGADVRHVGFPEVFLGLIPAWGGTQLAPRLIGAEEAVRLVVETRSVRTG